MKILQSFTLLSLLLLLALNCHADLDIPTVVQLLNTDKIEISLSVKRDADKQQVNMDSWLKMAIANDNLISKCYEYPAEKDAELFEEVCNTIKFIRNEVNSPQAQGFHRLLYVAGETTQTRKDITLHGQDFTLINTIDDTQTEQLLELCNKQWWAQDRTLQELETILKNSLYFVLIDAATQKIIGFIRAVTDYVRFAGIFDVMVDEEYQGKGLGKLLVDKMLEHPKISKLPLIELHCLDDKVSFYEKLGFEKDFDTLVPMRIKRN